MNQSKTSKEVKKDLLDTKQKKKQRMIFLYKLENKMTDMYPQINNHSLLKKLQNNNISTKVKTEILSNQFSIKVRLLTKPQKLQAHLKMSQLLKTLREILCFQSLKEECLILSRWKIPYKDQKKKRKVIKKETSSIIFSTMIHKR